LQIKNIQYDGKQLTGSAALAAPKLASGTAEAVLPKAFIAQRSEFKL